MDLGTREGRRAQGQRIKQAAKEAGMTSEDLAQRIGCSRALIYQYVSGVSLVQTDRLQQIAAVVGKPLEWFFRTDDHEAEATARESADIEQERAAIRQERERWELERVRLEQRLIHARSEHLNELVSAYSSGPNWRKVADACQLLAPELERQDEQEQLAELLLKHGNALIQLAEWGSASDKLERAASLFRSIELPERALGCLQSLGQISVILGRPEVALTQFGQVANGRDWWNRWQGTLSMGAAHELMGDYAAATGCFEQALDIVEEREGTADAEIGHLYVESNWANVQIDCGEFAGAAERADRCIRLAQRNGVQDQYLEALLNKGFASVPLLDLALARQALQSVLDLSELAGDGQRQSLALSGLSICDSLVQHPSDAVSRGKEALAIALRSGAVRSEIVAQRALAQAYLAAENPAEAEYHADAGIATAVSNRVRLPHAQLLALKAKARLSAGDAKGAKAAARDALKIAAELDAAPVQLDCHTILTRAGAGSKEAIRSAQAAVGLANTIDSAPHRWEALHALAEARRSAGEATGVREPFKLALAALSAGRQRYFQLSGSDSILEIESAANLWKDWLRFIRITEGADRARSEAETAEWPPLLEWLEQ